MRKFSVREVDPRGNWQPAALWTDSIDEAIRFRDNLQRSAQAVNTRIPDDGTGIRPTWFAQIEYHEKKHCFRVDKSGKIDFQTRWF